MISSHVRISYRLYRFVTTRYTTEFYTIKWFSFVVNKPTSAQKLALIICGYGWLGWKWIATWKNWPIFSSSSSAVYFREVAKNWLWSVLNRRKTLIFPCRCCKSNFHFTKQVRCKIYIWAVLTKKQQNRRDSAPLRKREHFCVSIYGGRL